MKHLKHIHEMDSWATPNRLGGDYAYTEITEKTIKDSLRHGPPIRVKIKSTSEYYRYNVPSNPKDVIGTVIEFDSQNGDHPIRVRWDNGSTNSYRNKDLVIEL